MTKHAPSMLATLILFRDGFSLYEWYYMSSQQLQSLGTSSQQIHLCVQKNLHAIA